MDCYLTYEKRQKMTVKYQMSWSTLPMRLGFRVELGQKKGLLDLKGSTFNINNEVVLERILQLLLPYVLMVQAFHPLLFSKAKDFKLPGNRTILSMHRE